MSDYTTCADCGEYRDSDGKLITHMNGALLSTDKVSVSRCDECKKFDPLNIGLRRKDIRKNRIIFE